MPFEAGDLSFGDIILVPFPSTNQASVKRRPAVVISSDDYNSRKPDIILMAITSQLRPTASIGE
jgi:mRNA interferase MazF